MASKAADAGETLEVRRTIRAPREKVFDAWTDPEEIKRWHAPGPAKVLLADIDLRVGGAYRIHMLTPDGQEHRAVGIYKEINRPSRLVYTWAWENKDSVKNSVVTIEFLDREGSTDIVLRHDGLPNATERTGHSQGWTAILEKYAESVG
jgi:glutathione S-transferase